MGKHVKFLLILALLLFQSGVVLSQRQTDITKLESGKNYKIVLFDGSEIIGKFVKTDSIYIKIELANKSIDLIPANDINYFTANLAPEKYKFSVSLTGGASFLSFEYNPFYEKNISKAFMNLNLSGVMFFSDSKAIKIDAGYTYVKADNNLSGTNLAPFYSSIDGGNVSIISVKGCFIIGRMKPDEKFIFYAALGFGVNFAARDEITIIPNDSAITVGPGYIMGTLWINPLISLGGTVGYRFSKNFGALAEIEYNMLLGSGESMFTGKRNYFPLRAGLFYIF